MGRARRYRDRSDAGRVLADELRRVLGRADLVLGLPRGGVPVAAEVATALGADLDVLVVRKIGVPGHEELAMGAVASGGLRVLNDDVIAHLRIDEATIADRTAVAEEELRRRSEQLRGHRPTLVVAGRVVVVVDDGLATGATMRAALVALRAERPTMLIAAVPVGAPDTCRQLSSIADRVVCPLRPRDFGAVGWWYADFSPTTDQDVTRILGSDERRR